MRATANLSRAAPIRQGQTDGEENSTAKGWQLFAEELQPETEAGPLQEARGFNDSGVCPQDRTQPPRLPQGPQNGAKNRRKNANP